MITIARWAGFAAIILSFTACTSVPPAAVASHGTVQVDFDHPERFTDVRTAGTTGTDPEVLAQLRDFLIEVATPYLAPEQTLAITFTDLDLAGDLEPWHVRTSDIRIIRDIYPPRASFTWTLKDRSGQILRQGTEKLIDTAFMARGIPMGHPLFYDQEMLRDWVRRTFAPAH